MQDDFFADPYPFYSELRRSGAPYWLPHAQQTSSAGIWLFSRYADGLSIFKKNAGISKNLQSVRPPGRHSAFDRSILLRDGEDHLRLRRLISGFFSVQSIDSLRPAIISAAEALLQPLASRDEFDLIREFAEPLPLTVIALLIGVPHEDMAEVRSFSLRLCEGFDSVLCTDEAARQHRQAMDDFLGYVRGLIEAKRAMPDTSLLSMLIEAEGKSLDAEELVGMMAFLLFAGHETTVSLIGNAVWLLLSHRSQWESLRREPGLIPDAVEEVLRFESPEQRSSFRILTEPLTINGHTLEAGQQIGLIIGSMNRDESIFERADEFDIRRSPNKHVAFGVGIHHCLGKTLTRVETGIALEVLTRSLGNLHLKDGPPAWRKNSFFRGLESLPVFRG